MLIDAHAHIDKYEDELEDALQQINEHRIFTISNSMDVPSYRRSQEISKKCDLILPTFGIHPWNAHKYADNLDSLTEYIDETPMVGEIGLDYYFTEDQSLYPAQKKVFEFFLAAAATDDKIINVHTKGAEEEILELISRYQIKKVIVHWYSGPLNIIQNFLDFGAFFTIGVELLHSKHIQEIGRVIPSERLLLETDNPGGWRWLTGLIGMPLILLEVTGSLAELRGTTEEEIIRATNDNFRHLIEDDPRLADFAGKFD